MCGHSCCAHKVPVRQQKPAVVVRRAPLAALLLHATADSLRVHACPLHATQPHSAMSQPTHPLSPPSTYPDPYHPQGRRSPSSGTPRRRPTTSDLPPDLPSPAPGATTPATAPLPLAGANALLCRIAFELLRSREFEGRLAAALQQRLDDIKRPSYLHQIILAGIDLGSAAPVLTGLRAASCPIERRAGGGQAPQLQVRLWGGGVGLLALLVVAALTGWMTSSRVGSENPDWR